LINFWINFRIFRRLLWTFLRSFLFVWFFRTFITFWFSFSLVCIFRFIICNLVWLIFKYIIINIKIKIFIFIMLMFCWNVFTIFIFVLVIDFIVEDAFWAYRPWFINFYIAFSVFCIFYYFFLFWRIYSICIINSISISIGTCITLKSLKIFIISNIYINVTYKRYFSFILLFKYFFIWSFSNFNFTITITY